MGGTNYGTQTIIYNYKYPAKGRDFSKTFRGILKPGIYSGLTITKTGDNTVSIAVGIAVINTSTDKTVIIKTSVAFTVTVLEATPVIYAKFDWVDSTGNYADFLTRADGSPVSNEIILGKCNFSGGVITTIDYTDKTFGLFDADFNMILSGELSVDTINEKTSGNGVTIDGSLIKDGVAKFDTINEKTASTGVGIETVDGSVLRTKIIEMGDWDMDSSDNNSVAHGISNYRKIKCISVIIRDDSDGNYYSLCDYNEDGTNIGVIGSTYIYMSRAVGGNFDGSGFDSTSYNRGWVTIQYID